MRNTIKEFIEPSKSEKQEMWNRAIFVFDTNVLLNLYRYSAKTRKTLLEIFDFIKDRIWCPYQVAWEFMKDRNEVIIDTQNKYEEFSREIDKFMETVKQQLRVSPKDDEYEKLENMLNEWLENYQKHNLLIKEPSNDQLLEKILELFDGKVGKGFSKEELEEIKSEGKRRYEQQIPPGYLDAKKQKGTEDNNTYGDFIIWKEIIQYAKENKIDVLFITDDQKADWWNIVKGRTMGPRIELRKEFRKETELRSSEALPFQERKGRYSGS